MPCRAVWAFLFRVLRELQGSKANHRLPPEAATHSGDGPKVRHVTIPRQLGFGWLVMTSDQCHYVSVS